VTDEKATEYSTARLKRISTEALFEGSREILISHNGETYRLRITAKGRLILTK
jgi:hemin uptake protein HemP